MVQAFHFSMDLSLYYLYFSIILLKERSPQFPQSPHSTKQQQQQFTKFGQP